MKLYLSLSLILTAGTLVADDAPRKPAERPRLTDELRHGAENVSATPGGKAAATAAGDEPIMMAPVRVRSSNLSIVPRIGEEIPQSLPFTWKEGGTLLKNYGPTFTTELKCQYNGRHKGFDILSISW
jgi:hypothetical protein